MKKGSKGSEKELNKFQAMPLPELNENIKRCLSGYKNGGTSAGRKSYFKRLVWLEKIREEVHGVEAPYRDYGIG